MRIFVYGSLRRGFGNHRLLDASRHLGNALTEPIYSMLDLGGIPGVIVGGSTAIYGELYDLDDETLRYVDALEGHPLGYRRTPIKVFRLDAEDQMSSSGPEEASIYLLPQRSREWYPIVESGDWRGVE